MSAKPIPRQVNNIDTKRVRAAVDAHGRLMAAELIAKQCPDVKRGKRQ